MWYQFEQLTSGEYRVVIKFWHPAFIAEAFRNFREAGNGIVACLYYTAYLMWVIAKRK